MIFEVFNQNSKYYGEMMNVILKAKNNPPEKGQVHHIIPRCWFKHYNLDIDNSISNTVLLSYEDHKLIHQLGYKCAKERWFKSKMACAAHLMGDKEIKYNHDEETKRKISESHKGKKLKPFTKEHKRKLSESLKGKNTWMKGKKRSEETRQKLSDNNSRYWKGRNRPEETKRRMSNTKNEYYKNEENRLKCGRKFKGKTWIKVNGKRVWRNK